MLYIESLVLQPGSRQVRLSAAAYGKHPAWRDHIDEDVLIAAPTDELELLERWLHGATFEEYTSKSAVHVTPEVGFPQTPL